MYKMFLTFCKDEKEKQGDDLWERRRRGVYEEAWEDTTVVFPGPLVFVVVVVRELDEW
jgi:hypothetical protein